MNKKKSLYEAPTTDVLVVRFEGALLQTSVTWGKKNDAASVGDEDDDRIYSF